MKKTKKKLFYHIVNIVTIAMIVECFLCAMLLVEKNAEKSCFDRIEETTTQISTMFRHAMDDHQEKLIVFADILSANSGTPEELLQTYMANFCKTQGFAAIYIQRQDGTSVCQGPLLHEKAQTGTFHQEVEKLPYISDVISYGSKPENNFVYQAVPVMRDGQVYAVLYGYMSLDIFPSFIASSVYGGRCQFYIVDGKTGDFLMDEYHGELGNIFDGSMREREAKPGYNMEDMRDGIRSGRSGIVIFRSQRTDVWYYTYYMPLGINNWSMQLTIDEPTAFEAYRTIRQTMLILMLIVICLIVVLIASLMIENAKVNKQDKARLYKSNFINAVQHSLLNAYTNADSVVRALRTVAEEVKAETVLLLTFSDNIVTNAQYWPSSDKAQAMNLIGRNIREDFPVLYDRISTGTSMIYDKNEPMWMISETAAEVFQSMGISRLFLVPILDTTGRLKGAISAVNPPENTGPEMIENVVYDFFMAITNLENHSIIKKMGAYDYLTGLKNRNSFETEIADFATIPANSLWCAYVDANGLHELNNLKGHKAGDLMLCSVAHAIKKIFGGDHAYRLGGDEFVVFKADSSHEEFMRFKYRLLDELQSKGYSVSIGFEGARKNRNGVFDVDQLLTNAEAIMYQNKRKYYAEKGNPSERDRF